LKNASPSSSATISQRDGRRARVILLAAQGRSRNEIARLTGLCVVSVTRWCKRFQELRLQGLVDLPGQGRKPSLPAEALKRTLEQVTQPRIGQPRWSCRSMARVAGISPASVQRIWAANDIHSTCYSPDRAVERSPRHAEAVLRK
jgi:transposase